MLEQLDKDYNDVVEIVTLEKFQVVLFRQLSNNSPSVLNLRLSEQLKKESCIEFI